MAQIPTGFLRKLAYIFGHHFAATHAKAMGLSLDECYFLLFGKNPTR